MVRSLSNILVCISYFSRKNNFLCAICPEIHAVEPLYNGHPGVKLTGHCINTCGEVKSKVYGSVHVGTKCLAVIERWSFVALTEIVLEKM